MGKGQGANKSVEGIVEREHREYGITEARGKKTLQRKRLSTGQTWLRGVFGVN